MPRALSEQSELSIWILFFAIRLRERPADFIIGRKEDYGSENHNSRSEVGRYAKCY